jgi:hypothetical protein
MGAPTFRIFDISQLISEAVEVRREYRKPERGGCRLMKLTVVVDGDLEPGMAGSISALKANRAMAAGLSRFPDSELVLAVIPWRSWKSLDVTRKFGQLIQPSKDSRPTGEPVACDIDLNP